MNGTTSANGELVFTILAAIATYERRLINARTRAFDEKVESLIGDSHDGANRIQDPHWCKGGQS